MKTSFPGDREFNHATFLNLPYAYILESVEHATKLRVQRLHEEEKSTALIALQQAEIHRDRKKQKRPYELTDFFFYWTEEQSDSIDAIYSACASEMIERKIYPTWALFVYKQLMVNAGKEKPPEVLCYMCEDVLILGPKVMEGVVKGMLIAEESASRKLRTLTSPCGKMIKVMMPRIETKIIAQENVYVDLVYADSA